MIRKPRIGCLLFAGIAWAAAPEALAGTPDPVYAALRAASPQADAIAVSNFTLQRDAFRFHFESGNFFFLSPVEGRTFGAVFVGSGTFELRPATEIERRHLAFVTRRKTLETLSEPFDSLVFLFTDRTTEEVKAHGQPAKAPNDRARSVYEGFFKKQRKSLKANLQIRLLQDAVRAPAAPGGVFIAYLDGKEFPPAIAAVDPAGLDWIFPQVGEEGSALFTLDDLKGGLWYCSDLKTEVESGKRPATRAAVHALHYTIETTIRKNEEIAGTTTIRFKPLGDDLRVLPVRLLGTLRLQEVSYSHGDSGDWAPATFIQEAEKEDANAAVIFPASQPRDDIQLRLSYEGKGVILEAGRDVFFVSARTSWYPNLGTFTDLASFDLTYRLPKGYKVVSVGHLLEERVEGDNKISIWRQERPIRVAGFNYGKLRHLERPDRESGITLDIYATEALGLGDPEVLEDAATADGFNTARVGTFYFGALPESRVSITQQSQFSFGQSWPSLIYLPSSVARDTPNRRSVLTRDSADFVDRVGSHEFAHQWWGHLVGWAGYRDQWLSEGFAEFTSSLVVERIGGRKGFDEFWEHMRMRILEKPTRALIANDEAGPIAEGLRLSTWQNGFAGQAMIYTKGAYVLHMLRAMMRDLKNPNPDARFIALMKDFATSYAGQSPSTRDFQSVVERHMIPGMNATGDGKMDWFFKQWVFGTEIPRYREKLEVAKKSENEYRISGTIAQEGVSSDFHALAHIYVEFPKGELAHLGVIPMIGSGTTPVDVTVRLPKAPKRVMLNAFHDVLWRD